MCDSDGFKAMFESVWKGKNKATIDHVKADAFKEFLQFSYLDDIKLTMENVAEVMCLGHEYRMIECVNACKKMLVENQTNENVCGFLSIAMNYDRDLVKTFKNKIAMETESVIKTSDFLHCDKEVLTFIVETQKI